MLAGSTKESLPVKSWIIKTLGLAVMAVGFVAGAQAQERGTKDEAKALSDAAFEHVKKAGAEQACRDFISDKAHWMKKDLYVAVTDFEGVTLAHGSNEKLVGRNMLGIKDANGGSFMAKRIEAAKSPTVPASGDGAQRRTTDAGESDPRSARRGPSVTRASLMLMAS